MLNSLPYALQEKLDGYNWERNTLGWSADYVFYLQHTAQPAPYLKISTNLAAECARTIWLRPYLPIPEVHYFAEGSGRDYLLLSATPGEPLEYL
jgi:aminoglycoside 3'-phosphotransferase II